MSGSSLDGVLVQNASGNRLERNVFTTSSGMAIRLEGASGNTIADNLVNDASGAAIGLQLASNDNRVERNVLENSELGIHVLDSDRNHLVDNDASLMGGVGVLLENAQDGVVLSNDLRSNSGGIQLLNSTGNRIEANDASEGGGTGISLEALSLGNVVVGNIASANDSEGIYIGDPAPPGLGNLIDANIASNNAADGITVNDVGHMIRGNVANNNGGWGIYAALGTVAGANIDGGQNSAQGNIGGALDPLTLRPLQCFGVSCDGSPPLPVDPTAPETSIASGPSNPTSFTSATLHFTGSDNATTVTFQCRLDSLAFVPCSSPQTYTGLSLGSHTFEVRAVDFSGNTDLTPAVHAWTIVPWPTGVAPDTTIDSGPDFTTVQTTASFTFSANEENVTFQCKIDTGDFTGCASPKEYGGLAVGPHEFQVRAVDSEGNTDSSPDTYAWTVSSPPASASVTCGQVLTQSTLVANDLLECSGNGLVVGADGITIDLNGRLLDGIGLGVGVLNPGFDGVTIVNGSVQEFDFGVQLGAGTANNIVSFLALNLNQVAGVSLSDADNGSMGNTIRSNDIVGNNTGILIANGTQGTLVLDNTVGTTATDGVRLEASSSNRLEANRISGSSGAGIVLDGSSSNTLFANNLAANSGGGVSLLANLGPSNDNLVDTNTIATSGGPGIEVIDSNGNDLIDNNIKQSSDGGIVLDNANNGVVRGNDVRFNAGGIEVSDSTSNLIESNNASATSGGGIMLSGLSFGNVVRGNAASGNSGTGIESADAAPPGQGNVIESNVANNNSGDGIEVGAGHTVTGNTVDSNDGWGILAQPGVIDGGGNRATGNAEPAQCFIVVCEIGLAPGAPDTQIDLRPTDPSNSRNALFTFIGTDDTTPLVDLSFECRLDSTSDLDWAECNNPQEYFELAPGTHTFEVRAVDLAGQVDPTPATYTWTYVPLPAGVAPDTFIGLHPPLETWVFDATFTFSSNEPDVTYECALDAGAFEACEFAFQHEFDVTQTGLHTFRVRATDFEGNTDQSPAENTWRILGPSTVIISGPAFEPGQPGGPGEPPEPPTGGETGDTTATFEFVANVADATYVCSLDLAEFTECQSPITYTGLAIGEHSFRVLATDSDGVLQAEPTEYEWTVIPDLDVTAPDTTITGGPADPSGSATFTFTGTDNATAPSGLVFECSLDDPTEAGFATCTSAWTYPNPDAPEPLTVGPHTFYVRAIDLEGNVDGSPAELAFEFTGDTIAPVTTITMGPPAQTALTDVAFTFSANDPFPLFECSVDGAAFEPCESPNEVQGVLPGPHELQVQAERPRRKSRRASVVHLDSHRPTRDDDRLRAAADRRGDDGDVRVLVRPGRLDVPVLARRRTVRGMHVAGHPHRSVRRTPPVRGAGEEHVPALRRVACGVRVDGRRATAHRRRRRRLTPDRLCSPRARAQRSRSRRTSPGRPSRARSTRRSPRRAPRPSP